jgi:hypothetical protein
VRAGGCHRFLCSDELSFDPQRILSEKHGGKFYALQARDCVLFGFTEILPD